MSFPYIHDFGSILRFIELNFGVGQIAPAPFISEYADINAPDGRGINVPLSDFFPGPYRAFIPISVPSGKDANYFINFFTNNPAEAILGPDGGDSD